MEPSMSFWQSAAEATLFGAPLWRIALAAALILGGIALRAPLGRALRVGLQRLARRTETAIDDRIGEAVEPPLAFAPIALAVFLAAETLQLTGLGLQIARSAAETLLAITLFWALARLVEPLMVALRGSKSLLSPELTHWAHKMLKVGVWAVAAATILELWGVRVLPIIAGFGLLGVAVALGAQDLFKNLISGALILSERRFRVGDWVQVDGVVEGTVESIGFRSTKVRRFDKAPVYVPNSVFANDAVVNFGEMTNRRIFWRVGLEYSATAEQLQTIRDKVEALIAEDPRFLAPPAATRLIRLDRMSDSSIDLMVYCFTETRDWATWLAIKEELLLGLKRIVEEAGTGFAYPSRALYFPDGAGGGGALAKPESGAVAALTASAPAAPAPDAPAKPAASARKPASGAAARKKPAAPRKRTTKKSTEPAAAEA